MIILKETKYNIVIFVMQFLWVSLMCSLYLAPLSAKPLFTSTYINHGNAALHPLYLPNLLSALQSSFQPSLPQLPQLPQLPSLPTIDQSYGPALGSLIPQLSSLFNGIFQLPQSPSDGPSFIGTFG